MRLGKSNLKRKGRRSQPCQANPGRSRWEWSLLLLWWQSEPHQQCEGASNSLAQGYMRDQSRAKSRRRCAEVVYLANSSLLRVRAVDLRTLEDCPSKGSNCPFPRCHKGDIEARLQKASANYSRVEGRSAEETLNLLWVEGRSAGEQSEQLRLQ